MVRIVATEESRTQQADHLARLRAFERYPGARFHSPDDLAKQILRTAILDLLVEAKARRPVRKPNMLPQAPLGRLFKGRERFLEELHRVLGDPAAISPGPVEGKALRGLGGVGKTRLAIEFGHRHAEEYSALFFLSANTSEQLRLDLATLVGPLVLDLPAQDARENDEKISAALGWLAANPGWFLIIDNVDTEEAAAATEKLLARLAGGHVLITGRIANFSASVETLELDVLSVRDATAFLLERTSSKRMRMSDDATQARVNAEELGQLALALEQAGSYIEKNQIGLSEYLSLWRKQRARLLNALNPRLARYPQSVAVTWATSVEQLSQPSRMLLDRLAWLAPEPIPNALLDVLPAKELWDSLRRHAPIDAREALAGLFEYSLASSSTQGGGIPSFVVHRLVQEVTRHSQE